MSEEQNNVTEESTVPATTGEAAEPSEPLVEQEISALSTEIETLSKEVEEWRSRAHRYAADLDNFRKRALKERDELRKYAIEGVLKDLIPVADNLERALAHAGGSGGALADGVAMIAKQYMGALEKHGAKPFDPRGEQFDPQFHEAMSQMDRAGAEAGTIVEVYQRGWMLHDRLVRPAMVVIATGEPGVADSPDTTETATDSGEEH